MFVHVNFSVHGLLFAGFACHGLPDSASTQNNGVPVWRVRVLEG